MAKSPTTRAIHVHFAFQETPRLRQINTPGERSDSPGTASALPPPSPAPSNHSHPSQAEVILLISGIRRCTTCIYSLTHSLTQSINSEQDMRHTRTHRERERVTSRATTIVADFFSHEYKVAHARPAAAPIAMFACLHAVDQLWWWWRRRWRWWCGEMHAELYMHGNRI
jgi:hypothetical protein